MSIESVRYALWIGLHCESDRRFHLTNGVITFFIIFSVAVIPLHFVPGIDWVLPWIRLFDQLAVTLFTLEYALRIWTAKDPWGYILSFFGVVDLMAILPFYVMRLGFIDSASLYLLLRIVRLFKFTRMNNHEQIAISSTKDGASYGLFYPVEDEKVQRVVQRHPIIFLTGIIPPLLGISTGLGVLIFFEFQTVGIIVASLIFLLSFFLFYKAWLDYVYDVMIITNRRVILQDRDVFGVKSNDINYQSVSNVIPNNRGFVNWLFSKGAIQLETAAHEGTLDFNHAPHPLEVVKLISANRQRAHRAREEKDVLAEN